ncbi:hypothetical protein K490DRAFT_32170 [Saccharata proteae CBS 121410]|uniref:Uncharacterized protein n=1 Tax=Saccharata proteae CBS 121410 TaxID=1314787 RepID=A0A9P4M234_9PEZI|nr:hypothetical protein K490DRAFT_32170 [Saccharata proteae CBS 121410]
MQQQNPSQLPTRTPSAEEQKVIDDVLALYQLRPSEESYAHYADDATFHDPVSIAPTRESIQSQFNGMPKLFADSVTEHYDVLDDSSQPRSIVLNLTQKYVFKSPLPGKKEGSAKTVNSKITLKRNAQGLITEHIEEWDHEKNKTSEDGFMGKVQEFRKKMDAKLVESTVSSDPSKV